MAERLVVDQRMCDTVKFMLAGGAPVMKVQALMGISPATISRIRSAGFSAQQFMENNAKRREEDAKKQQRAREQKKKYDEYTAEAERTAAWQPEAMRLPGQVQMELPADGSVPLWNDIPEGLKVPQEAIRKEAEENTSETEQKKLYRFLAGQFDETEIAICDKLGKIYDMMGQILRAIRKE